MIQSTVAVKESEVICCAVLLDVEPREGLHHLSAIPGFCRQSNIHDLFEKRTRAMGQCRCHRARTVGGRIRWIPTAVRNAAVCIALAVENSDFVDDSPLHKWIILHDLLHSVNPFPERLVVALFWLAVVAIVVENHIHGAAAACICTGAMP